MTLGSALRMQMLADQLTTMQEQLHLQGIAGIPAELVPFVRAADDAMQQLHQAITYGADSVL